MGFKNIDRRIIAVMWIYNYFLSIESLALNDKIASMKILPFPMKFIFSFYIVNHCNDLSLYFTNKISFIRILSNLGNLKKYAL